MMMLKEYTSFAVSTVRHRQRRSWLTVLGIFIGIAAVVALISISQGLKDAVSAQFELIGADTVIVMPGRLGMGPPGMGSAPLTEKDVNTIEKVRGVGTVAPVIYRMMKVEFGNEEVYTYVMGLPSEQIEEIMLDIEGMHIIEGKIASESDKYGTIVGYKVRDDLFNRDVKVGSKLDIGGKTFTVRGVLSEVGNRQDDTQIYIHLDTAREVFNEPENVGMIMLKVKPGFNPEKVAKDIEDALEDRRGEKDFSVMTSAQLAEMVNMILGIIQMVLVGVAGISLLVGGVGIMNTMYTSVQERTRQIGIMKAVGATNEDVMMIFLFESGLLGLVGGTIGCAIGMMMALGVESVASGMGYPVLKASLSPFLMASAIGFSFLIGVLSGTLPARNAARMNPVDALRYE